jgi:3-hydroxy-3-methylglutaryl CoA synthase
MLHPQTTTIGILMSASSESLLSSSLINVNNGDKLLLASFREA